jgi:hypothetical protein
MVSAMYCASEVSLRAGGRRKGKVAWRRNVQLERSDWCGGWAVGLGWAWDFRAGVCAGTTHHLTCRVAIGGLAGCVGWERYSSFPRRGNGRGGGLKCRGCDVRLGALDVVAWK